jgi:hypothetical protein
MPSAGVTMLGRICAMRDSNPRALPSRRQGAGFPTRNFGAVAALAFAISYVATNSRVCLFVFQIDRPVRVLDLDVELASLARQLVDPSAHCPDIEGSNETDLRSAVPGLLLSGGVRHRLQSPMQ